MSAARTVGYCGELHNADIKGTLRITQGAQLSGVINSTRVSLSNVVPSTTITIKLDLRDFAVANYVETEQNEHGNVTRKVEYFANYTTRTTEYTYSYKVDEYNSLYARVESITVTNDTFDNADGRFDMSNWEYRFEADIGVVDSMSLPHIQVDFGGTEKEFNSGTLKFDYPSTTREIQFRMNSNTKKWEEQWVTVYEDEEEENVKEEYYRGYISYNAALYGETEDVLWLSNGEESNYSVTLDPIMKGAVPANDVIPGGGSINGATLTVKGENVNSGRVTVKAEDSEHRSLTCDLELLVVPKELPVIGKSGTSAYTNLLKKAQKDRLSEIRAELPCDAKLDLGGMKFSLSNMSATLTVNWSAPSITMKLEGKLDWTFGKSGKTLTVDLSGDNYFSVTHSNKQTDWDIVGEISVPDFSIGRFAFSDMYLSVNKGQSSVSVSAYVQLPGIKYKFGGSIGVVDGYLDSMSIGVGNLNVPLGATGLMLQSISGSIEGIATSLDMTFGGNMGFTYGPKVNIEWNCDWLGIDDGEYSLLEIDVGATISTSGEITGSAGISSLGGFITGAGGVTAREGYFSVNGNFSLLNGCITIEGELLSGTGGVVISGKGRMQVPKDEKFGLLAGVGLSVEVKADFGSRYVLAWENIVLFGNTYAIGCKTTFDGEVELLGSADIWKEVENTRGNLRSLKSISVKGISVAEPLRGETTPSASEKYTVSGDGVSLFQFNFSVSGTSVSLSYDGTEYTQAEIMAGNYDNMQIVNALTTSECITIAVNNANSGEWTMNAYGDGNTTFGAYTIAQAVEKPVVTSVTLGDDARSATINYTLGDMSALKNATVSIFRNDGGKADHGGLLLAEFTAADATGTFEYVMTDEMPGGDYAFYLMVTSDNLAPGYSDLSAAHKFLTIDTEAPDRIQRVNAEWKSSGTVLTWEAPYDNSGVTGYKVRYRTSEEDEWSEGDSKTASFVFDSVPNGTYAYQVAACDEAGNIAAWSEKNSVLVLTTANAAYKDITLTEDLVLKEYVSAVNINAEDFALTSVPNTLVSGSTLGNAALSGIMEDSTVNGKVVLQADGLAGNTTVNGTFEIQGTAEGVTVADGGSLLICRNAVAKNITVNAGGSVLIYNSAAEVSGLVMDRGVNLTIAGVGKYQLTDDIRTAGTLTIQSFVVGNGHRIHFEQYKQADEITSPGTDYARDDIAFLSDFDDLGDGVLEIEIDSSTFASYKIADKFTYFKGAITVTDHASGVSAAVGFDDYTVVGNALCMLSKTGMGGYGTSGLYLIAKQAAVAPPTITVTNADSDLQDTITVRVASPCAKRTYRYSLNEDMSDAVVVVCDNDTPLSLTKSDLTANATYYIQAKVESEYGIESPWSTTTSFTVVPKYNNPLPSVTAEKNGNDWIILTVTGMETAEYKISICDFRYADNPEMENAVSSISYQEEAWFSRAQFVEGKDYYFQVRVQSRGEWSEWGPTLVFNTQGWDYDGITVGTDGQYTELWLDNKKARNITVTTGGSVYGSSAEVVDGITINGGSFLACSLVTNAVVNSGDFWLFSDSDVSDLVVNGGNLHLQYGRLNGAIIGADATATLDGGYKPTITGTILIQGKMEVSSNHRGVTTDAQFVFDLGAHEAMKDTMFIDFTSPLVGTRTFTVKLDDTPEKGDYTLTYTPKSGEFSISLAANNGTDLGVLGLGGEAIQYNGLYYSLFSLDSVVYLHVSADDAPVLRGKIKLSRNGTVFAADNRYQNLTVSASDKCDHVLVEEGGQLEMVTVGDGGSIDVYGDVYGATVEQGGKLTMNLGCVLADRPVNIQKGGEIIVNGGSVSVGATVNVAGTMTVNGALQSCEESQTEAAHEFAFILDRFDAPNTDVLISDYELVKTCNASFSVSVSMNQAAGEYQLMGNAADFSGSLSISFAGYDNWRYDLTIGKERSINGTDFALAVRDNILTLTVGGSSGDDPEPVEPGKPDGNDNPLMEDGSLNLDAVEDNPLEQGGSTDIIMDAAGSVEQDGYNNFVGEEDKVDNAKITLEKAAKLSFTVKADSKVKFTFYQLVENKKKPGTYTKKALKSVSVTKSGDSKQTASVLVEGGWDKLYYVAVENKNSQSKGAYYNVSLTTEGKNACEFFSDGDNGDNNILWNKTDKWNEKVHGEDVDALVIDGDDIGKAIQIDTDTETVVDHDGFTNFVGFGDAMDVRKIELKSAAKLSFDLAKTTGGAAKLVIYTENDKGKMVVANSKLTVTTKAAAPSGSVKNPVVLQKGVYYISVQSTDAKKGKDAYYNVSLNANSVFYEDGDSGMNDFDSKTKKVADVVREDENAVALIQGNPLQIDGVIDGDAPVEYKDAGDNVYTNFVGTGDDSDIVRIDAVAGTKVSLTVTATDAVSLVVYGLQKNGTLKALKTVKSKNNVAELVNFELKAKSAPGGQFFLGVTSTNAKKGSAAYYNVDVVDVSGQNPPLSSSEASSLAMPETDNLAISDALSFGGYDTDVLADASASSLANLDDKSAWLNIASLA